MATGHYARVVHNENESYLLRGVDDNKDQTYFLCQISKKALSKTIFPIGELTKSQVREIALELQLDIAKKKDSTGICFIGERNFKQFLQNYLPSQQGDIFDINTMQQIAKHDGVLYYTIGQRKGLGIGGNMGPWFVVGKNVEKNRLYVSNVENQLFLYADSCIVNDVCFLNENIEVLTAKFRYRQKDYQVNIQKLNDTSVQVIFNEPISAVTPGQYAVFYHNDICVGGGIIDEVYLKNQSIVNLISQQEKKHGK